MRAMLQIALHSSARRLKSEWRGVATSAEAASRAKIIAYEIARFWLRESFSNKTIGADADRDGG